LQLSGGLDARQSGFLKSASVLGSQIPSGANLQRGIAMPTKEKVFVFVMRMLMAWTFIYAASHQVFAPGFSVAGFLKSTKTFHDLFAVFATPAMAPIATFLVEYGHLAIGLSLLFGFMVRVSSAFGVLLLMMYWMAHMDFPYIENHNNFLIDYHVVYSTVLAFLIYKNAGHVWGLDAVFSRNTSIAHNGLLRPMFG
jgi:thiosulfate dehydrogenase [quinone] large subunit